LNLGYFLDKPSPPENLKVKEVTKTSVTLSWKQPSSDGGSKITGYIIEKADASRGNFAQAGEVDKDTLDFKVTRSVCSIFKVTSLVYSVNLHIANLLFDCICNMNSFNKEYLSPYNLNVIY
jgi:hypothetical protein